MARMNRADSTALTRDRVIAEARRLFRERGYAATSLEQIAEAAEVTKGAIYGHFSSKEDLLLSVAEGGPLPEWAADPALNDQAVPVRTRLEAFGQAMAASEGAADPLGAASGLEFLAAALRSPEARRRYGAELQRQITELAAADPDQPLPGTTAAEVWAIGAALLCGLQTYQQVAPEVFTPALFGRAFAALADFYPEETAG